MTGKPEPSRLGAYLWEVPKGWRGDMRRPAGLSRHQAVPRFGHLRPPAVGAAPLVGRRRTPVHEFTLVVLVCGADPQGERPLRLADLCGQSAARHRSG